MKQVLILSLLVGVFACDSNRIYEENKPIEADFWYVDSVMQFQFIVSDTSAAYNLYANFTHTSAYEFYNLYYRYTLYDSARQELATDLVNIHLFEPKTGRPLGSGLGDLFDHQQLLLKEYRFKNPGPYQAAFQQYMRTDSLPEMRAVGLRVELANPDSGE